MKNIKLYKGTLNGLTAKIDNEDQEYRVKPVRYFPVTSPQGYIGLFEINSEGKLKKETYSISDCAQLDDKSRLLLKEELNTSDPIVKIKKIYSIKQITDKLRLHVHTEKGQLLFNANNEDIHRIKYFLVLIVDTQGKKFVINSKELDLRSQQWLDAYI